MNKEKIDRVSSEIDKLFAKNRVSLLEGLYILSRYLRCAIIMANIPEVKRDTDPILISLENAVEKASNNDNDISNLNRDKKTEEV